MVKKSLKTVSFDPFYNQEYGTRYSRTTALQKEDSQLRAFGG
jgi:hypothetical protein